jgi:cytochrome c biogenesis protein CcmG/thiol:disulfide interchange protein DsbE
MKLGWDHKLTWISLMLLLFGLGATWTVLSRNSVDAMSVGGRPALAEPGFVAPDFTLETLAGGTLSLEEARGQVVLINFWATWCPPCRAEMPAIQRVYDRYQEQGLVVLAVNLQESPGQISAFAGELGLTFPILLDRDGAVSETYRVRSLPTTIFVSRSGVIADLVVGGPLPEPLLESKIAPLLREEAN